MSFRLTLALVAIALTLGLSAMPRPPHSHVAWQGASTRAPVHPGPPAGGSAERVSVQPF